MSDGIDTTSRLRGAAFGGKPINPVHEPEAADFDLPDPAAPYQAHARASNKPVFSLHCCLGKDGFRSFQYVHLDSGSSFTTDQAGHVITLRFIGTQVSQVIIRGRKLWRLYDYIHQHRMPWVMRADRNIADREEMIVTEIKIEIAGLS